MDHGLMAVDLEGLDSEEGRAEKQG